MPLMLWNALILALRSIQRNAMRSFLTTLGVIIGVAAVIIMVTLGSGATAQVTRQIASLGSNLLVLIPGQMGPGRAASVSPFREDDAQAIARDIPHLRAVAPVASRAVTAVAGNRSWSTIVTGSTNQYFIAGNWSIAEGRMFTESELRAGAAVCVIGATARRELYATQDPVGSRLRIKNISCDVVGLLESKGQAGLGRDQDDVIVIPLRTFQRRIAGNQDIQSIHVSVQDGSSIDKAQEAIVALLRERRHVGPNEDNNFSVIDTRQIAQTLSGTTQVLTLLLGAVAAVSLVVGGIGIMNIMLVSVTERTREIGIRLAIGALEREVLMQFLVEAVVLSSFGGVVGILFALASSALLARLLQVPFVFSPGIIALAFLFAAAVGVVFGIFPARKAARLDPIDALRHE
jgi:putative ABC transport system permease protein